MLRYLISSAFALLMSGIHPEKNPYDLEQPTITFEMPSQLLEISGLGLSADQKHLVAIQDENGILFTIDKETGEVVNQQDFWKDGDYEGVEMVGNIPYVIKSTGTLYEIKDLGLATQEVKKYKSFLNKENDVEGLGLDAKNNRLLIACKAQVKEGDVLKPEKHIYGMDLNTMQLDSTPVFTIGLEEMKNYLERNSNIKGHEKISDFFTRTDDKFKFSPCSIAVHPITGNIYITSSVGKLLLIIDASGQILHIEKLSKKMHPQPEGLCFDQLGNLYVANEGKDGPAVIHKYLYKSQN